MFDVLEKCLISDVEGTVLSFLDIHPSNCSNKKGEKKKNGDCLESEFEEGTVVGLDKLESDTYRVQFLLKTGFIQLVKEVPSRLPFLIPDKGWAVCTPTKVHQRVSRLELRDKVYFKVDESMPSVQSRGSLKQRLNSAMFDDSDFDSSNLVFPEVPQQTREGADHVNRDRKERKDKLMSHIVSSTMDNTLPKEETVLTSKMKRSVPGDFRSSVEAGRTGKHGLTDPNDSSDSYDSQTPNVTIKHATATYSGGGECNVTSTRNTPGPRDPQWYPSPYVTSPPEQYRSTFLLHNGGPAIDRTLTPGTAEYHYLNNADPETTPVNYHRNQQSHLTPTLNNQQSHPTPTLSMLQTPVRRRIVSKHTDATKVTVTKTVSIPVCSYASSSENTAKESKVDGPVQECRGGDGSADKYGGDEGLTISHSCESINVTDD